MREWLKYKRICRGFSQEELAELVGIDNTSISKYEVGERNPSVDVAKKIADILEFSWVKFYESEVMENEKL